MDWNLFFPSGASVLALPSWQNPRLYLPAQNFLQRWKESSFYPTTRYRARLYHLLLRIRASTGLVGVRVARSDGWPLREFVQDMLPQVVSAVAWVGTPGPAQKVTAQLRDKEGRVLGYLKYAEKEGARSRLYREHHVLSNIPRGLGPQALKYGTLGNGRALLTTPISGKRLPATLPPPTGAADYLISLPASSPTSVEAHPWVRSTWERGTEGIEIDACFEALAGRQWPVVAHHGDFAPWNLLQKPGGTIGAFDWEYGTLAGFPYLDVAYYALQTSALIYRWAPAKAAQYTVRYLTKEPRFGLSSTEARALTRLAAYDAYHKSLEDGQTPDNSFLQTWRRAVSAGE